MDIALISDIHSNLPALRAVLAHIMEDPPDAIYCLGDNFVPYSGAAEVWALLKQHNVKCVLGNNEVAILSHLDGSSDYTTDQLRYRPMLNTVKELAPFEQELRTIPASRSIPVCDDLSLHLCHYSPDEVYRGLNSTFNANLDTYVQQCAEPIILTGHRHIFESFYLHGKTVYTIGSAGLPLKGTHQMEYARLRIQDGSVDMRYHLVPYPVQDMIETLLEAGFMRDYGPIAWLCFEAILTQRDPIVPFFRDFVPAQDQGNRDWYELVERFLKSINRWEVIRKYIGGKVKQG